MPTEAPEVKAGKTKSIFEFEGYVNDDDEGAHERELPIDPIWEKQQKKVSCYVIFNTSH